MQRVVPFLAETRGADGGRARGRWFLLLRQQAHDTLAVLLLLPRVSSGSSPNVRTELDSDLYPARSAVYRIIRRALFGESQALGGGREVRSRGIGKFVEDCKSGQAKFDAKAYATMRRAVVGA